MTREELKEHCKRQVQQFERVEKIMPVTPNDWKRYEEHKLILELLEQEPRWIPVTERLPEEDGDYLLFGKVVEDDTEDIFIGTYDTCEEKFGYWEDYYDRNSLGFLDSEFIEYNKVIAWQPLQPYKGESEDKE